MTLLELVSPRPDWLRGLGIALTRPEGVPERRQDEDPWSEPPVNRPRRISDDLVWLRQAMDEPSEAGLKPLENTAAEGIWQLHDQKSLERLLRLRDRGVLDATGFLLHEQDLAVA